MSIHDRARRDCGALALTLLATSPLAAADGGSPRELVDECPRWQVTEVAAAPFTCGHHDVFVQFIDVHDDGTAVGTAYCSFGWVRTIIWRPGTTIEVLDFGSPTTHAYASGIDARGRIYGAVEFHEGFESPGFIWILDGTRLDLVAPPDDGEFVAVAGVSDDGTVAGWLPPLEPYGHGRSFTWRDGEWTMLDEPVFPGGFRVRRVADDGTLACSYRDPDLGIFRAFILSGDDAHVLPIPEGTRDVDIRGISSTGVPFGTAKVDPGGPRPVHWPDGEFRAYGDAERTVGWAGYSIAGDILAGNVWTPETGSFRYALVDGTFIDAVDLLVGADDAWMAQLQHSYGDVVLGRMRLEPGLGEIPAFRAVRIDAVPGDVNCDTAVGFADLLLVLGSFGCEDRRRPDLDGDGIIDLDDLSLVLANWD